MTYHSMDMLLPTELALDAKGRVTSAKVKVPARQMARFARALQKAILKWKVPNVPRAGTCRIMLHTFATPPDRRRITEPFEMAPNHTEMVPQDWRPT